MPSVSFNVSTFRARYPEFSSLSDDLLGIYFDEACMYLDNTDTSRITKLPEREHLLNMLTAHIAKLNNGGANVAGTGRIASASEGSVSVSYDMPQSKGGLMAWFYQTQYGVSYWAATARYRTFIYSTPCRTVM